MKDTNRYIPDRLRKPFRTGYSMRGDRRSFHAGCCLMLVLCLFLSAVLAGCSSPEGESQPDAASGTYKIYRQNADGDRLVPTKFKPSSEEFQGILREVLDQFRTSGKEGSLSTLPDTVKINSSTILISEIDVDFSTDYLSLDKVQELLLRCALVETLLQLPGVDSVRFTVEGQPLVLNGTEVGAMTADSFIVPSQDAINSTRSMEIPLYFSNAAGDKLLKETRKIYYSSNLNKERVVAEEIISGPDHDSMFPVTTSSVIVLGARVRGSTCLIDFSKTVNDLPAADSKVNPEVALYAFVNAICDACGDSGITGVQFTIDGKSDQRFRGQVNLDQTFRPNQDYVDQSQGSSDEADASAKGAGQTIDSEAAETEAAAQG